MTAGGVVHTIVTVLCLKQSKIHHTILFQIMLSLARMGRQAAGGLAGVIVCVSAGLSTCTNLRLQSPAGVQTRLGHMHGHAVK